MTQYSKDDVLDELQIGCPLLLVDGVTVDGLDIAGKKRLDADEFFFGLHFLVGEHIMPGTLQLEMMTQVTVFGIKKILMLQEVPIIVGINNVRFFSKVLPGDVLYTYTTVSEPRHGMLTTTAYCKREDQLIAQADFKYTIGK